VVAGHIIECGAQCTGGNYSFFEEVPALERIGFPVAEMHGDGSSVITKHPGTGGLVTVGTVTAQLLYEIGSPHYLNPDVTSLFESISLTEVGPDRVMVSGVQGEPPPVDLKVALNYHGGYRNSMTFGISAPDVALKSEVLQRALWEAAGPPEEYAVVDVQMIGDEKADPATNDDALSYLRVVVKDPDPDKVGRRFSGAAVELALSSYPGFFLTTPPGEATAYAVYWPATLPAGLVPMRVVMEDREWEVTSEAPRAGAKGREEPVPEFATNREDAPRNSAVIRIPLGTIAGARSGDKGGNANVGFWVRTNAEYRWIEQYLTTERLHALLPEADGLQIDRYELSNLLALNFVIHGLLGEGVSSSTRTDPQAKSLGEFLRARWVEVPKELIRPKDLIGSKDLKEVPK
jgi:acyclic terpene utilization AtuA family protein